MSAETMRAERPQPASAGDVSPRPRRVYRSRRPAASMLSQGESMLWLTGGALALCLAMIVGLLGLIIAYGMTTFWPLPLVRLETIDGQIYLGEITRESHLELDHRRVAALAPPQQEAAQRWLDTGTVSEAAGDARVRVRRRLLRTGNFDLTQTHFHWVTDFELADEPWAETYPEWALILERTSWGRFYGEPKAFAVRHPRKVPGPEERLHAAVQFLESNQYRISDEPTRERFQAALQPLRERRNLLRAQGVERFLASFQAEPDQRLDAVVENGPGVPVGEVATGQNVTEVQVVWETPAAAWSQFGRWHQEVRDRYARRRKIEKHDMGRSDDRLEEARLAIRRQEIDQDLVVGSLPDQLFQLRNELDALRQLRSEQEERVRDIEQLLGPDAPAAAFAVEFAQALQVENRQQVEMVEQHLAEIDEQLAALPRSAADAVRQYVDAKREAEEQRQGLLAEVERIRRQNGRYELRMVTAQGQELAIRLADIVRAYPANQLSFTDKLGVYGSRWTEFLTDEPREANSEGGVVPPIVGTVALTLIMSLVVVPFGVLAALYLREYARAGPVVSAVRISINNLAGVPSIVFGVFGMTFFINVVGAYIDGGPRNADLPVWPPARWFAVLLVLGVLAFAAFVVSLASLGGTARPNARRWRRNLGRCAILLWLVATVLFVCVIGTTPHFTGLYETSLPNPKFGKGGLLWAALTLALLTLPVVIVATEEALAAVPNSLREGSYACGAGKWQTIRRIVLPHAMPGVMTGMILAMARGAGEVAPLMLVGALFMAPELPIDGVLPFLHPDRGFMHLGFHIYGLGFQSQNSMAAQSMVFTTTLLLVAIVAILNLAAVCLRSRLRKRFLSSAF
jgi:phosphate transport system permease protein